tara:strand:+ start:59 stop:1603 length:1545 start_codon:yes stop_codon:yes gene_type:complete
MKLIKNAHVLTLDEHDTEHDRADILIEGSKIIEVGPDLSIPTTVDDMSVIDARGLLAMPGLVNGHFHSPGNFLRGAVDDFPLEIFMLYEVPPFSNKLPPQRLNYVRTLLSAIEMLKLGITSVHDDAFYNPYPTQTEINSLMQAYVDIGMRAVVTIDTPNVIEYEKYPFLYDLLPAPVRQQMATAPLMSNKDLIDLYGWFIDTWNGRFNGRIGTGVSCSAPQRVNLDYLQALSELSTKHQIPYDIHILESKLQRVLGEQKYGKSLIRYVHDAEVLNKQVMVIHAVWVDQEDMELMAQSNCSVAHNPLCNLKIGSGIMPFRRMRSLGIPIGLGTDEASVDDTANLWQVGKTTGLIHKITDPEYYSWPSAHEILDCLVHGGARGMGLENKIGVLASGYEADLILVDLNTLAFTPLNDLRRQLVYCENGSSVVLTMVAGNVVAEHGRVLAIDEEEIKAEVRELMIEYDEEISEAKAAAQRLYPYYREMYLKSSEKDVGFNRWATNIDDRDGRNLETAT